MKKLLILILIPFFSVIVWGLNYHLRNEFNISVDNLNTLLGQASGILAISMMGVNFLLASKLPYIEKVFMGQDKLYKWHMYTSRLIMALIFIHPVILMWREVFDFKSFMGAFFDYFVPDFQKTNLVWGIISFWGINFLVLLTVAVKLPYQVWKKTHGLMILFYVLAGIHGIRNIEGESLVYSLWYYFVFSIGIFAYVYLEIYYKYFRYKEYKIDRVEIKGNIIEFELSDESIKFKFKPGQFVNFSVVSNPKISKELHPFTISSMPGEKIRFSVKNLGDFSKSLENLKVGDVVRIWGPHGMFGQDQSGQILFPSTKSVVFIAGGIGITPFLSILRYLRYRENVRPIYLIYSCKNEVDAIYLNELESISKEVKMLTIVNHQSDIEGFLDINYFKKLLGNNLTDFIFFVCGPKLMIRSITKMLQEEGVSKNQIKYEDFSFK